jgi:tRNA (cytidine/uridine-2'-O-)-methyltransferase
LLDWEAVEDWEVLTTRLPVERHWYFSKKASRGYLQAEYATGDVLVFGPESRGLPDEMLNSQPEWTLRIPTRPEVRSLNLSNCVAIAAYEALRQLETNGGI